MKRRRKQHLNSSNKTTTNIPAEERALVLQGGGSLGAYEAGAYKALYEWLSKEDKKEGKETSMTFDNIAGTSIGAMNAAVLTSYVVENGTYEGSAERLIDFWNCLGLPQIDMLHLTFLLVLRFADDDSPGSFFLFTK